ncbi:hypothetical protein I306_06899 [Cryptococcus gattii EJB2]|uniref:Uncharacterized protein n=1 Tax=Cryptococcus gattii EJB2 TaxID=1296103 RepID=A0ABR5BKE7_9TREE|nr:hypothetical protein I306_06899 [Cryptococcus gattii EJB2]
MVDPETRRGIAVFFLPEEKKIVSWARIHEEQKLVHTWLGRKRDLKVGPST